MGRGWGRADTVDKATLRGLQMASVLTARILFRVATDPEFPGRRRTRDEVLAQAREAGLEIGWRGPGELELAGR